MNKSLGISLSFCLNLYLVSGLDLGLSLTGMRIGPRDPVTHAPKVGIKGEIVKPDHTMGSLQPRVMKERAGFSGGFKIPEEFRKSKSKKKSYLHDNEKEEDLEGTQQSQITKDEIFHQLNLGHSDAGLGVGRHGTNSKAALAKDLVEGIEKDLEKLRRQQENLQLRKTLALNGGQSIVEETKEEKDREIEAKLRFDLETAGTFVIDASPKKLQVMRHQASQLASVKNLELDDLERMRLENEKRLKELEEIYIRKKENSQVGRIMRERMGFPDKNRSNSNTPRQRKEDQPDFDRYEEDHEADREDKLTRSEKKKRVRIVDEKENHMDRLNKDLEVAAKPVKGRPNLSSGILTKGHGESQRSLSGKRKKADSPIEYDSPRRKLYEAKFEKFLANKNQKHKQEKKLEKMQKEDFDRYTKGPDSPAKSSKRFLQNSQSKSLAYDPETLLPKDYDEELLVRKQLEDQRKLQSLKKDKFKSLGVSNEDKMTFFLLKWIFNAIKRESPDDEPKLKGRDYVTKVDLIKQLGKNDELMKALGYHDQKQISQAVKSTGSVKEGCLVWEEFLDFFFLRQATLEQRIQSDDNWWHQIGNSDLKRDANAEIKALEAEASQKSLSNPTYRSGNQDQINSYRPFEDPDRKPVQMTGGLKMLQETRMGQTLKDVEEEFKALQDKKLQESKQHSTLKHLPSNKSLKSQIKAPQYDYEDFDEDDERLLELGIQREKSECLLLQSQIFIMQEIFEAMDKYKDKILRRSEFIMALRTDERVVEFIDVDAVKVPYSKKTLNLDQILEEIEKDEVYELTQIGKKASGGQINHKEFITWREFMSYFNDYKEIEERNKKSKEIQKTRQNLQRERAQASNQDSQEQGIEITSLMEKEKQRRLKEMPQLRPADQIDITEKQLQLLKNVFDSLPRFQDAQGQLNKDAINTIDFFIATRKNPQLRQIASAIARDPEGYSRIPRETFQQVFDRMEAQIQAKVLEWPTIVEYFTKRGRPLTKDEINRLIEEDKRLQEEEESKKRAEEEQERRRLARLMEEIEDKQDYEEFELKQKFEEENRLFQEKKFNYNDSDEGSQGEFEYEERRGRSKHRFLDDDYDGSDPEGFDDDIERGDDQGYGYTSDPELRTAKRSVKFGNREDPRRERAKSAKGGKTFDERNIRNTKLSTKDYIDHERSQSKKKKGKYGVTVPKPFNFDIRDKTRSKSIRERKVQEMVAEKKVKEENIIKHQFRSNPIPPEVLIPRYKSIIEANELRRMQVKQNSIQITKIKEKPFSFYERDKNKQKADPEEYLPHDLKKQQFKANPIPRACSVLIFDQMVKKQEEERQERVRKQAELNFSKAKLPERMQMHQEKLKQEQQTHSKKSLTEQLGYSFKPKINELVTREQFEKAQQKFNQKLNKKKAQQQVTRPKSPNFQKTSSKTLERQYLNEEAPALDRFKQALQKNLAKAAADKAPENPSSTVTMNLLMQKKREDLEAKRKAEEAKKKEDEERREKQNRMKGTVQAALKDRIKNDNEKREEERLKKQAEAREQKIEAKKKLDDIKERVKGQPLLIERLHTGGKNQSNLAKIKATKAFLEILKSNNVDPKDHLTDEQKDLLAEHDFIERRKKELGKI